jgi:hypothetical protein
MRHPSRRFISRLIPAVAGVALLGPAAAAQAATFTYTGGEQTYQVPSGVWKLRVTATGAPGGGPSSGLTGGRAAVVSATVPVTPRQLLFLEVGGAGGLPQGGFNGGADGGARTGLSVYGGGGASDLRALPRSLGFFSLESRGLVAAGGGGSAWPAAAGGDAGAPGGANGDPSVAGGAGEFFAGGAGGACDGVPAGCGTPGTFGAGGAGGASGDGAETRIGGGGGGGLFGGGGGGAVFGFGVGGGGGGSSVVAFGGTVGVADLTAAPGFEIIPIPGRRPADPDCYGRSIAMYAHDYDGIRNAAEAYGVTIHEGHNLVLALCGRSSGTVPTP